MSWKHSGFCLHNGVRIAKEDEKAQTGCYDDCVITRVRIAKDDEKGIKNILSF